MALGTVASPIGELFVAVTPRGLACVAFEGEDRDALIRRFASALSPRVLTAVRATDDVRRQLDEYFEGVRPRFELRLDRRLMTPFAREVLDVTAGVPFGQLATYGPLPIVSAGLRLPARSGRRSVPTRSRSWSPAIAWWGPRER